MGKTQVRHERDDRPDRQERQKGQTVQLFQTEQHFFDVMSSLICLYLYICLQIHMIYARMDVQLRN